MTVDRTSTQTTKLSGIKIRAGAVRAVSGTAGDGSFGDVSTSDTTVIDNEVVRFDGTGGQTIQGGSGVAIDDSGHITGVPQLGFFFGTFLEQFDATIASDGSTITMSLAKNGGGDLTTVFSSGYTTHTAGTITLTAGSDSSPQGNWVYILKTDPTTLVLSTSSWPATEHIKVTFAFCQSAASMQTAGGPIVNQNWNDFSSGVSEKQGHLAHLTEKVRVSGSTYFSGAGGNGTTGYLTITAGNVELKSTAGVVYQLHAQAFAAFDTSGSDTVHVKNWSGDAYKAITNLHDITADSTGTTITNNKYFNLTLWGVANKAGTHQTILINLPSGFYNTQSDAEGDVLGNDDFTMPREFSIDSSTGFLLARITIQMGTTWTWKSEVDLRGQQPVTAKGGAAAIVTSFADNTFTVFDQTDNTKIMALDVGALVSTGNTRTLTVPDESGTIFTSGGPIDIGGSAGMRVSANNGTLTILGLGDGNDEDLTLDFNTTPNTVIVSTTTGVTTLDLTAFVSISGGTGAFTAIVGLDSSLDITGLASGASTGGSVNLTGGTPLTGDNDGGSITITGGPPSDAGTTGSIIFAGNSEDIVLDFTGNTLTLSTTTLLDLIDFGAIGLTTSGTVTTGPIDIGGDLDMNSFDINELDNINAGDTSMAITGLPFGAGVGTGGTITLAGGTGGETSGNGGNVGFTGGDSTSGLGGSVVIAGGASAAGNAGGFVSLTGGNASGSGMAGGAVQITGGVPGVGGTPGPIIFAGPTENILLNFTSNTLTLSTTTNLDLIDFGAIGLSTTGTLLTGSIDIGGAAGVRASATNGVLTLLGLGSGQDESLIIDFDTTANAIVLSSGSSANILKVLAQLHVPQFIIHTDDTHTFIQFTPDRITFDAGGKEFMDFTEATVSTITFNSANANMDFTVNGDTGSGIHLDASNGSVSINLVGDASGAFNVYEDAQVSAFRVDYSDGDIVLGTTGSASRVEIAKNSTSLIGAYAATPVVRPDVTGNMTSDNVSTLKLVVQSIVAALSSDAGGIGFFTNSTT